MKHSDEPGSVWQLGENLSAGATEPLLLIAGPCQIESSAAGLEIAAGLQAACQGLPLKLVFKASFDKANRTSLNSARGPGLTEGLAMLAEVKRHTGLPLLTDIHQPEQAAAAAAVVDILQIPAFLCRQTDLLIAAGQTGRAVQIKKGQFLDPADMAFSAEKVAAAGRHRRILLCERGSCFGYRDLVVDMRGLVTMAALGYPVVFDATHSVQSMGGAGGSSGGRREFVAPLARAAAAVGLDGLFLECHTDPARSPSDAAVMLPLVAVRPLLEVVCEIRETVRRSSGGGV